MTKVVVVPIPPEIRLGITLQVTAEISFGSHEEPLVEIPSRRSLGIILGIPLGTPQGISSGTH